MPLREVQYHWGRSEERHMAYTAVDGKDNRDRQPGRMGLPVHAWIWGRVITRCRRDLVWARASVAGRNCSNRVRVCLRQGFDAVGITGIPKYVGIGWLRSTASALKTVRCSTWTLASSTGRCRPHSSVMKPAAGGDLDSVVLGLAGPRSDSGMIGTANRRPRAPELAAALAPAYGVSAGLLVVGFTISLGFRSGGCLL
jgi:hypothetical protein